LFSSEGGVRDSFRADEAWLYITVLTVVYMTSRGLAKSRSDDRAPTLATLAIEVGLVVVLIALLDSDRLYSREDSPPHTQALPGLAVPPLAPQAAVGGAVKLEEERSRRVRAERRANYARRRKNAWQRRARRAERTVKQLRARSRGARSR
jgi:hypothetical protein